MHINTCRYTNKNDNKKMTLVFEQTLSRICNGYGINAKTTASFFILIFFGRRSKKQVVQKLSPVFFIWKMRTILLPSSANWLSFIYAFVLAHAFFFAKEYERKWGRVMSPPNYYDNLLVYTSMERSWHYNELQLKDMTERRAPIRKIVLHSTTTRWSEQHIISTFLSYVQKSMHAF